MDPGWDQVSLSENLLVETNPSHNLQLQKPRENADIGAKLLLIIVSVSLALIHIESSSMMPEDETKIL